MTPLLLAVLAFSAAAGLLVLTPGLDTAMVLRTTATNGARGGAAAALGIALGVLTWGTGAAFGLTALLAAAPLAFTAVKWAGAAYLLYLGLKLLAKPRTAVDLAAVTRPAAGDVESFRRGVLSNILNPKAGVFYVTFLPQFIPPGYDVAAVALLLTAIHVVLTLIWFAVLIGMVKRLSPVLRKPSVVKTMDRLTGCVFIGFGLKLALAEHR